MKQQDRFPSHVCLLALVCGVSLADADGYTFVVQGTLIGAPNKAHQQVGVYIAKSSTSGPVLAEDHTGADGKFALTSGKANRILWQNVLWVASQSTGDTACEPQQLTEARYKKKQDHLTIADVDLTCNSVKGGSPTTTAAALVALAKTHEVYVWSGAESLAAADAALQIAVARADEALQPNEREKLKAALALAAAPLREGAASGLELLPSLKRDDFAGEMLAAAPGWRWLARPERDDQLPAPYGEHDGRFEGNVVHRVGSTFSDALVSLSEGPLSIDPATQASIDLTWPATTGSRVCLEARATVPRVGWNMREAATPGSASFRWDLKTARSNGVKADTLGVVARTCADADLDRSSYLPVHTGDSTAPTAYRLVFLFPRQLTDIHLEVFQGGGAARRVIALPASAMTFDRDAQAPTVTIVVPTSDLQAGAVHLEMSARGPGKFGPDRLSFLHAPRASR